MYLGDFHVHTNQSDGKLELREVVDLFGRRGFGAIAITDHLCEKDSFLGRASRYLGCSLTEENFFQHMESIKREGRRAWDQYRMLVIPGFEITKNTISNSRSAHLLAIGTDQYVNPSFSIENLCQKIRSNGGLSIAAHPVSTRKWEKQTFHLWDRREEYRHCFDAWEVASGPYLFEEVLHSGLPMVASSDLHNVRQMRSWKTVLRCEKELGAVLQAIRSQEISFSFYENVRAEIRVSTLFSSGFSPLRTALRT